MSRMRVLAPAVAGALAAALVGPLVGLAEPALAADGCGPVPAGQVDNHWLGGAGSWADASRWSRGVVPGVSARDLACLPTGSDVVVDSATPQVDLDVLVVGADAHLTLRPGTALSVWGDPAVVRSLTRRGSVVEVDGATLGGGGVLQVNGRLDVHAGPAGERATLATQPDQGGAGTYAGPAGILQVKDHGTLDIRGSRNVRLSAGYVVDVHGRARLRGDAGIAADHGTTFLVQQHLTGPGLGKLVIRDDHGFREGRPAGTAPLATFVNRGRILKKGSSGSSRIVARYAGHGAVRARTGRLVLPHRTVTPQVVHSPVIAQCGPLVPCTDPQEQQAALKVPVTDTDGVQSTIAQLDGQQVKGEIGVPMEVHASGLDATIADPAVIVLRYAVQLFADAGKPADPAQTDVGHADGGSQPYTTIPSCEGIAIPLGAFACVDRGASRLSGGDVVMVVRTVDTSRWIVH
jgi:hypothetical protein